MKLYKTLPRSLCLLFFSVPALSQTDSTKTPVISEDMHIRADKNVGYGAESSFLIWHGYLNFEFDKRDGSNSNFDNHEFYLSARSDVSERVSVVAEFEYEHSPEKLILPIQAYALYKFDNAFIFRVGIFFTPLGMPRSYNLRGNRNRMIRQVAMTHDIAFENWSETGVEILGQFNNGIFYDLSISNGMPNTIRPGDSWFDGFGDLQNHTEDLNENKAMTGRIGYHSRTLLNSEVNIAVSGSRQKYDPTNKKEMNFLAADLRWVHNSGLRFQAEYMERSGDEHLEDLANYGVSIDAKGWYFQVSKRFTSASPKKYFRYVEPAFQIDQIDLNTAIDNNKDLLTSSIGVIYSPEQYYLVKFEYDFVKEQYGPALDNNMFWASIVVEF